MSTDDVYSSMVALLVVQALGLLFIALTIPLWLTGALPFWLVLAIVAAALILDLICVVIEFYMMKKFG